MSSAHRRVNSSSGGSRSTVLAIRQSGKTTVDPQSVFAEAHRRKSRSKCRSQLSRKYTARSDPMRSAGYHTRTSSSLFWLDVPDKSARCSARQSNSVRPTTCGPAGGGNGLGKYSEVFTQAAEIIARIHNIAADQSVLRMILRRDMAELVKANLLK